MLKKAAVYLSAVLAAAAAQAQEGANVPPLKDVGAAQLRAELLQDLETLNEIARRMQALKAYQAALGQRLAGAKDGSVTDVFFPKDLCSGQMENICAFLPITTGKIAISSARGQGE